MTSKKNQSMRIASVKQSATSKWWCYCEI